MRIVNMREAKTNLSRLVDLASEGEGFVIAKAGKPMVKVVPLDDPPGKPVKRLCLLEGEISVPADFDRMAEQEVSRLFSGDE
ncbi:MAG: type II toxin-antitoxin system prevent-host-death family antitoxin [Shinella sp.]|nr:type II toxin-antitoxin system prevent-host-death family antitoxin [Shinella sp.]